MFLPPALYDDETWICALREENAQQTSENKGLGKATGPQNFDSNL
jgi:hypothetical protein